ncbi:hypothetical protein K8R33_02590 [archaeon]|nr:hypothetical protein [archaeon]
MGLEELTKREKIRKQTDGWVYGEYHHTFHYLTNVFRIIVGKDPKLVGPNNKLVNSEFIFRNKYGQRNDLYYARCNRGSN